MPGSVKLHPLALITGSFQRQKHHQHQINTLHQQQKSRPFINHVITHSYILAIFLFFPSSLEMSQMGIGEAKRRVAVSNHRPYGMQCCRQWFKLITQCWPLDLLFDLYSILQKFCIRTSYPNSKIIKTLFFALFIYLRYLFILMNPQVVFQHTYRHYLSGCLNLNKN